MLTLTEITELRPKTIEDALEAMEHSLQFFHRENDFRAVFLRAYYIITTNVHNAIRQQHDFDNPIFFDPNWIRHLSGRFASLYFASLTTFKRDAREERAWKLAYTLAKNRRSSVIQDLLLGINAHINYDLPVALCENLRAFNDKTDFLSLTKRKFDHDQVNNILIRSFDTISTVIPREYGGLIRAADSLLGKTDERLTRVGLKHYRERVWWDSIALLSAGTDAKRRLVMDRLNWESAEIAKTIAGEKSLWIRTVNPILTRIRRGHFKDFIPAQQLTV